MGLSLGRQLRGAPPPVILDTDISTDADDAVDPVHLAHNAIHREVQILGAMCSTSNIYAPGCLDAIFAHMGQTVPIGTWKGGSLSPTSVFTQTIYDGFPHPNTGLASTVPDMMTLYASILGARQSADVTIITTGFLNSMAALLAAQPALIAAKVRRLIIVAGNNNGTLEPNMDGEGGGRQAAHDVAAGWPTELIQVPCTIGTAMAAIGGSLAAGCPAKVALTAYGFPGGRQPWSNPAFDYAAGYTSLYTLTAGTLSVNASTGVDTFTPGAGTHKILSLIQGNSFYEDRYNLILNEHGG